MRHLLKCLLTGFGMMVLSLTAGGQDQLVVFVQPGRSISQHFIREELPKIEGLAKGHKLALKVVDATQGAPGEVTFTPAIFYQKNGKYRLFEGRYNDAEGLANFVRKEGTPRAATYPKRADVAVWESGRASLVAHCKIEPLVVAENGFDEKMATASLMAGMYYLKPHLGTSLPTSARAFYLNFTPEKTADGLMLIQLRLYSEFDLETPLFESKVPSGSDWADWEVAFEKAGKRLEAMLFAQVGSNENGDGFEPLKSTVALRDWGSLAAYEGRPAFTAKAVGR